MPHVGVEIFLYDSYCRFTLNNCDTIVFKCTDNMIWYKTIMYINEVTSPIYSSNNETCMNIEYEIQYMITIDRYMCFYRLIIIQDLRQIVWDVIYYDVEFDACIDNVNILCLYQMI